MPLRRFWNSKVLGAASGLLTAVFAADMISLEMFRPRMPEPEYGFVLAQTTRVGRHFMTWYVSRLDLALELVLLVATMVTIAACLDLRRQGR